MPAPATARRLRLAIAVALSLVAASLLRWPGTADPNARAADDASHPVPLAIGAAAPDFSLPGVDGKTYSLDSFKASKVLVVIFTAVHCPTAEIYEERLKRLDRRLPATVASPSSSSSPTARKRCASTRWATPTWATRSRT